MYLSGFFKVPVVQAQTLGQLLRSSDDRTQKSTSIVQMGLKKKTSKDDPLAVNKDSDQIHLAIVQESNPHFSRLLRHMDVLN